MKFTSAVLSLAALTVPSFAQTYYSLSYDTIYDNTTLSLDYVACSDGTYGLMTKGFMTVGDLPTWPNVGGVYAVTGWDSAACGTCWEVTYGNTTLAITAIDTASEGFNLSLQAMDVLTDEMAEELGRVEVTATQVDSSVCGIYS
ncbi:Cerato-platanin [Hygrophoropsis aurantiaca]|uniref:Cerato-platanin n=1 Tax=Hygrophoropsis aurantiaca TaxID=72124 RepID=A0ACB8AF05_9AGAM|nr:Cerato-platanin [Hygrophoropsis aurantiaca]